MHQVVVVTNDKYSSWRDGLIPHTQDLMFWSSWASTATPLLAESNDICDYHLSQDKPPIVESGSNLSMGKRKNLMIINSKKQRAEHLLAMHAQQESSTERDGNAPFLAPTEAYIPVLNGQRCPDFKDPSPILKTFHKPPLTITDRPSYTTAHAKLAVTILYARDQLCPESPGFSDDVQQRQWSTIESKRGTAVIAAGDWLGIAGNEKFKLAQYAQQRDLLVTQAQNYQTYAYIHAVQGYIIPQNVSGDIR